MSDESTGDVQRECGTERLHVDLGTGLGGWTAPFRDSPKWRSVGIDIRDDLEADVVGDIRQLPLDCSPDLLTMSPPCTEFARWMLPWLHEPNPDLSLVEACLEAVDELDPDWWVLENSRGLHQYWREADQNVGPFYLWGNLPPVDVTLTDGGKMAVSGENPEERAEIPYELADTVRRTVESQRKLIADGGTVEDGTEQKLKVCSECHADLRGSDEPLSAALEHFIEEHPDSDALSMVLAPVHVKTGCDECGDDFISSVEFNHITESGEKHLTTRRYCRKCEADNPLREICVRDLTPSEVISKRVDRDNWHEPKAVTIDGTMVNADWRDVFIKCPECNRATDVNLPRGNCKHCGVELSVVVRTHGWHDVDEGEGFVADDRARETADTTSTATDRENQP